MDVSLELFLSVDVEFCLDSSQLLASTNTVNGLDAFVLPWVFQCSPVQGASRQVLLVNLVHGRRSRSALISSIALSNYADSTGSFFFFSFSLVTQFSLQESVLYSVHLSVCLSTCTLSLSRNVEDRECWNLMSCLMLYARSSYEIPQKSIL